MAIIQRIIGNEKDFKLQYRALHLLLFFAVIIGFLGGIVNLLTTSDLLGVLLPITAAAFCSLLYYYARKGTKPYIAKLAFILFIDFIYFPLGWITSAGSLSSMPYYSILFLVVTFLIIEYQSEYVIPVLFLLLAVFMMYVELRWPGLFSQYKTDDARIIDIAIHYAIVALLLGTIFALLLSKYTEISKGYSRSVITDELTGLYSRTYGIKQLKLAFENSTRFDTKYTAILFRLHNMKNFNLVNGPIAGDRFIKELAQSMINTSRSNDICCRYHGCEFLVLLNHTDISQVEVYLNRIYDAFYSLSEKYEKSDLKLLVGKADFDYNDINEVMKAAEQDLDASKKELLGGNND